MACNRMIPILKDACERLVRGQKIEEETEDALMGLMKDHNELYSFLE